MEEPNDNNSADVELYTEMFVKMTCQSCVASVKEALTSIRGVSNVTVDLDKELVKVTGEVSALQLVGTLKDVGKEARVIGLGARRKDATQSGGGSFVSEFEVPKEYGPLEENSNAVAEFKGKLFNHGSLVGIVRFLQLGEAESIYEVAVAGLSPNTPHSVAVHTSGDLSKGHDHIGPVFSGLNSPPNQQDHRADAGFMCESVSDDSGRLNCYGIVNRLKVWEVIGRSLAIDRLGSEDGAGRVGAAVIARSSGVGGNYKKVCTCDGTVIYKADGYL